ncbi:unnamed protein product [Chilo suppressalis]|uniref:BESS domain-containing protein n=1 Tax=Chilo suppressalis TaxID=168631 RepID=A0ABN8BD24_CHISP|nr:unnamed protein product [Chilo suppressalis]
MLFIKCYFQIQKAETELINHETRKLSNINKILITQRRCSDAMPLSEESPEPLCPLAAKDSEWVDILQTPNTGPGKSSSNLSDGEEELQLVDGEDGPQTKPLAIMFPGILEKDPSTLQGMLNKAMSTTEVTRHLVDLGQKANFTFMKQADRLIPRDKQWLESLTEDSNSVTSMVSCFICSSISSDYEADNESTAGTGDLYTDEDEAKRLRVLRRRSEAELGSDSDQLVTFMKQIITELIMIQENKVSTLESMKGSEE